MGGESLSIAQQKRKANKSSLAQKPIKDSKKNDDPNGDLGLTIRMDGESLSIAQKKRLAQLHEHNFLTFTDHPDPPGETPE